MRNQFFGDKKLSIFVCFNSFGFFVAICNSLALLTVEFIAKFICVGFSAISVSKNVTKMSEMNKQNFKLSHLTSLADHTHGEVSFLLEKVFQEFL